MTASSPIAQLSQVSHLFAEQVVLRRITMALQPGECVLLLGDNGAGKSTLLRVLAGLLRPRLGSVTLPPPEQTGYMAHAPMLYDELTALENLHYFAALHAPHPRLQPAQALALAGLDPAGTKPVKALSQGMRQRASLARVLLTQPRLLLLDEPFSNMDAGSAQTMLLLLGALRNSGAAIVLTTHQRELAAPVADRILRLHAGALQQEQAA